MLVREALFLVKTRSVKQRCVGDRTGVRCLPSESKLPAGLLWSQTDLGRTKSCFELLSLVADFLTHLLKKNQITCV